MRFVVLALALLAAATGLDAATGARAQDSSPPYLRGAQPYVPSYPVYFRWAGLYFGGHAGYTAGGVDMGNGTKSLIQFLLRDTTLEREACVSCWVTLTSRTLASGSYGGFMGYNSQWDDLVLGLEVNYSRVASTVTNTGTIERLVTLSDNFRYDVTVNSTVRVTLTDMASFRARAGYVMGPFLPWISANATAGRGSFIKAASVGYPPPVDVSGAGRTLPGAFVSGDESKNDVLFYGYGMAVGVDIALLQNVFVRGEYEYTELHSNDFKFNLSTVRAGLGFKF